MLCNVGCIKVAPSNSVFWWTVSSQQRTNLFTANFAPFGGKGAKTFSFSGCICGFWFSLWLQVKSWRLSTGWWSLHLLSSSCLKNAKSPQISLLCMSWSVELWLRAGSELLFSSWQQEKTTCSSLWVGVESNLSGIYQMETQKSARTAPCKQEGMEGASLHSPGAGIDPWLWESQRMLWEVWGAAQISLFDPSIERLLPKLLKSSWILGAEIINSRNTLGWRRLLKVTQSKPPTMSRMSSNRPQQVKFVEEK